MSFVAFVADEPVRIERAIGLVITVMQSQQKILVKNAHGPAATRQWTGAPALSRFTPGMGGTRLTTAEANCVGSLPIGLEAASVALRIVSSA